MLKQSFEIAINSHFIISDYQLQKSKEQKKIMPITIGEVVNHYVGPITQGMESMVQSLAEAVNGNSDRSLAAMR